MSIVEKAFLGSLMKAEYLLKDTVIQPEQLVNTQLKELMRRMVELNRIGKNENVYLVTITHNQTFIHSEKCLTSRSRNRIRILRNVMN
jgi:replicative DNA helicase